ncbi:MAG TPA: radical SAM family heme chaperone HemW [Fimbriimonadaceae bacterium]|nr:radical SAM family heme chaperone HemW [Fimbriimonadaceae bacterium]
MRPLAVYLHTPFCPSKCGYCDFNSYAMTGEIVERTCRATIEEIRRSPARGRPARTIFFGGGTPTFLSEGQIVSLLEAVLEAHPPQEGCEITSEANPGTVDMPKFRAMRRAGFNRISLGAQSFAEDDLMRLGRVHQSGHISRAVAAARTAGFENLNLDLMFALPGQSRRAWQANLKQAIELEPEHLSLYCLTLEPNTAFYKDHLHGRLVLPEEGVQVEMYDDAVRLAGEAGYRLYEISNFARPGYECRHNLCYWRGEEYAGFGPGAVGCLDVDDLRVRATNLKHPERYSAAVEAGEATAFEREPLDESTLRTERIMLGLRLSEGVDGADLDQRRLETLGRKGWISRRNGRVTLSRAGRHFCSEVALELI